MRMLVFPYLFVLVGVCLSGCRVHRQASFSADLQENSGQISQSIHIQKDTASVVSVTTGVSSGVEWKYTETYYPQTLSDTVPKLKSRSWEGKRSVCQINASSSENMVSDVDSRSFDTTNTQKISSIHSETKKEMHTSFWESFLKISLIMIVLVFYVLNDKFSK